MKKIIIAGFAVLALFGGAAEAQAYDWYEDKSQTFHKTVRSENCSTPGYVDLLLDGHGTALNLRTSPAVGQQTITWGGDSWDNKGPLRVTSVKDYGNMAEVGFLPGGWCDPTERVKCDEFYESDCNESNSYSVPTKWNSYGTKVTVHWQIKKRLAMGSGLAKSLTREALERRFSWYYHGNHGGYRCRISGNRGRCRHVFGIGDGVVIGVVKMRLIGRNGQKPVWSYKLNVLQIDELCRYLHAGNCTTRFKKQRNRVSLPYWVRAKNV